MESSINFTTCIVCGDLISVPNHDFCCDYCEAVYEDVMRYDFLQQNLSE